MADRTAAELFGEIFNMIANDVKDPKRQSELAEEYWNKSKGYDFDVYQMDCDEALVKLDYARQTPSEEYEDEFVTKYYDPDDESWEN